MLPAPHNQSITIGAAMLPTLLCIIFGANTTAIKISLAGLGKFTAAGLRFTLAAGVIALWAYATGRRYAVTREQMKPLGVVCLLFVVQIGLFYLGVARTYASRGALLLNVVPFFVLIFAHFFLPDDRISRTKFFGMLLGFTGVCLVLADPQAISAGIRIGDLYILAATVVWAASAVYMKVILDRFSPLHLVIYPMFCAAIVFFAAGWLWDDRMILHIGIDVLWSMLYQILLSASFGYMAWTTLLKRYGASTLHSFIFIMPISGVAAGALLLKEPVTHHILTAVILVTAGIAVVNFKRKSVAPLLPPKI
jgi:drug/metabolite transporter (DMT)-like permease